MTDTMEYNYIFIYSTIIFYILIKEKFQKLKISFLPESVYPILRPKKFCASAHFCHASGTFVTIIL